MADCYNNRKTANFAYNKLLITRSVHFRLSRVLLETDEEVIEIHKCEKIDQ